MAGREPRIELVQHDGGRGRTRPGPRLTAEELELLTSRKGLEELLRHKRLDVDRAVRNLRYARELEALQIELVKLQRSVLDQGRRVVVVFEGRDAAGKGGAIRRFVEHLSPRSHRVVALPTPTEVEKGQWYFQRYARQLPNPGEIVFFDRSWYNRAVVEPVMGFCTEAQYRTFMQQVPEFEHMLYEDGVELVKFWFSISREEQAARFASRRTNLLKQWKISPVDEQAQARWDVSTRYKEEMFSRTHTSFAPWIIVRANDKKTARLESIRYVLSALPYGGKEEAAVNLHPDPDVVVRFHRAGHRLD
ncbi:MAG: polyphosphate kinase 2 [Acidimicrobiia bacterium]|nr:polyphosphate kinase 2 [Acidimicrobiia bacterium]